MSMEKKDIVIYTSWSKGNKSVLDLTHSNKAAYCERHGYQLLEQEEPYSPKVNVPTLKRLLESHDLIAMIGADILIQKPELSIEYLVSGPYVTYRELSTNSNFIPFEDNEIPLISGGLSTVQPEIVNGDFLVWSKELLNMPWFFEEFLHSPKLNYWSTQSYMSYLLRIGAKFLGIIPNLQLAPRFYNPHLTYGSEKEEDYFCLHFHQPLIAPNIPSKARAISEYLEKHPELSK